VHHFVQRWTRICCLLQLCRQLSLLELHAACTCTGSVGLDTFWLRSALLEGTLLAVQRS
jgi:hypothetical protein